MTSNTYGPVVVGVDGTPDSRIATEIAAWEATRRGTALRLIYAHRPTPLWGSAPLLADDYVWEEDRVRHLLATARKEVGNVHPDLAVQVSAVYGGPASVLVAESAHASLVVVGTRAHPGIRGRFAGSVAAQVATHAWAPVVAVRTTQAWQGDPDAFTGRPVVAGVDGSEESMRALAFAVDEAIARRAPLHAVFVWDVDGPPEPSADGYHAYDSTRQIARAEQLLAEATGAWSRRYPDLDITGTVVHALDVVETLSRYSAGAGLVVVGSRGHGGFLGLRLGSTVDGLIHQSPAPVAVVRGYVDMVGR